MRPVFIALLVAAGTATATTAPEQAPDRYPHNDVSRQLANKPEQLGASIHALQTTLIELQQLQLQTKQAHWNVSGTLWYPLHLLLQEHYEGLSKQADTIAERLLSIGVSADGRATTIVRTSTIPEYHGGFTDDAQVIRVFMDIYVRASRVTRAGIDETEKSDPSTANLLQEVQHQLDLYQWQMRAHLQETPTDRNGGQDIGAQNTYATPDGPAPTPGPR